MDTRDDLDELLESCLDAARGLLSSTEEPDDVWEASELANRAIATRPDSAEAWLVKGQVMSALGDDPAALACVEKSLSLDPELAEANYWHAAVLADLERFPEALAAAERTFAALGPQDDWLLEELFYEKAAILDAMGERDAALATFEAGLIEFPDSPILKSALEPLRRERTRKSFKVIRGGLT